MTALVALLAQILHIVLVLCAAPATACLLDWLEARMSGRSTPPLLQPWRDLVRLTRKTPVIAESASAVLTAAPTVSLGATLCAAALVPSFTLQTVLAPLADGLVIASLLSVARVATVLGALDTGSASLGVAAQRNSALAVLAEPALLLFVFALALMGGGFNLDLIVGQQQDGMLLPAAASALALTGLLGLAYADITDAGAELDLDQSGIDLAVDLVTVWLRRVVWIDLIGCLFFPVGIAGADGGLLDWCAGVFCWAVRLILAVIVLAALRALLGRVARRDMPGLVAIAGLMILLATIIVLASAGTA